MKFTIEEVKRELDIIRKEQVKIDKLIQKQEEDDIFDDSLYDRLNELESKRNEFEMILSSLESEEN